MKTILILLFSALLIISCDSKTKNNGIAVSSKNVKTSPKKNTEPTKSIEKPGEYFEKYPNGKLKTEGWFNKDTLRDNIWYSYYENGIKWSELSYENGLKEGHSIVNYPNGKVHYSGSYNQDKKSGHWIFYKENGEIDKEEDY